MEFRCSPYAGACGAWNLPPSPRRRCRAYIVSLGRFDPAQPAADGERF